MLVLPPKMVQQRMGHASIAMTMDVYGHLFRAVMTVANWRRRREHSLPMPTPSHQRSRKRVPKPDRRRAFELLASCPEGCTEAIMLAHGFTIEQIVDLVRAGLASATAKRIIAGSREMEVATVRITDAGRRALTLGAAICGV